jgi:probable F420-dependent oxidoreductase
MARAKRTGLMLWPAPGLEAGFERGVWAEEAGFDDVWLADAEGLQDPIALAAALGVATRRVRLCTAVVPVFNRPPPVLATGVVAAEQRAPGRFVLGVGSSTSNMIDRWYGQPYTKPLTRVRETVALLRQVFAGEKTNFSGTTLRSHGFRLHELPTAKVPIYLGALGPKMLQLAGEVADGVILNDFTPPDRLTWAFEQLDIGAKRGGRRVDDLEIVKRRAVFLADTPDKRREALEFFRRYLAFYGSAEAYQEIMLHLGYRDAVEEILAGYAARDRGRTTRAISDDMVRRIFMFGDADEWRERILQDHVSGIDTVIVSPQAEDATTFARTAEVFVGATRAKT